MGHLDKVEVQHSGRDGQEDMCGVFYLGKGNSYQTNYTSRTMFIRIIRVYMNARL
jgi:hypothetical protein